MLDLQTTPALDVTDILRAELVMAVSVLDHYIHELARLGMLEAFRNHRVRTPTFMKFQVSLAAAMDGIADPQGEVWLEQEIRNRHSYQSFQTPENIAKAINLISDAQLWNEVARHLQMTSQGVRNTLMVIVDRRNKIVHEADMDPSFPGTRWPIDEQVVNEAVDFIDRLAETIYVIICT